MRSPDVRLEQLAHRAASAAGSRSARRYSVPIALASSSSKFLRWSYRFAAIEKVKPMTNASSVKLAATMMEKYSLVLSPSPCIRVTTPAPIHAATISSSAEAANTSAGWSVRPSSASATSGPLNRGSSRT